MPEAVAAFQTHSLVDWTIFAMGVGGVVLTQWRTTIGVKNEIRAVNVELGHLSKKVEIQNGRIEKQRESMDAQKIVCAETHGQRGERGEKGETGATGQTGRRGEKGETG